MSPVSPKWIFLRNFLWINCRRHCGVGMSATQWMTEAERGPGYRHQTLKIFYAQKFVCLLHKQMYDRWMMNLPSNYLYHCKFCIWFWSECIWWFSLNIYFFSPSWINNILYNKKGIWAINKLKTIIWKSFASI